MCWRVLAVTLKKARAVAVCFFLPQGPNNLSLCVPGRTTPGTVHIHWVHSQAQRRACVWGFKSIPVVLH